MTDDKMPLRPYHLRVVSQSIFFILAILGIFGIAMTGFVYPFFFCPASPAACAGCPIWVIEHGTLEIVAGTNSGAMMILYMIGLFVVIGALVGRSFCGWACPMGALQDVFSFFNKAKRRLRTIMILGGASFIMLMFGGIVPYLLAQAEFEKSSYLWVGYVGALGAFGMALFGFVLVKRFKGFIGPIVAVLIGAAFWGAHYLLDPMFDGDLPFKSVEFMGLLGLMALMVGTLGFINKFLDRSGKKIKIAGPVDRYSRLIKVGVLISVPITTWFFDTLAFTDIDPVGAITATIPELFLDPMGWSGNQFFWYKAVFTVGVLALSVSIDRGWCRYLCPIGAMYGPTNKFALTDIKFDKASCINCQICIRECPMGINPKENKRDVECIRCGRCVDVCPTDAQKFTLINDDIKGVFRR
ncbi:MAG: 4Fe-4S binding protein [Thermoplasmata archaeon]|nr:4Fe-4S binding protein [Thermoplasmata archaeon]